MENIVSFPDLMHRQWRVFENEIAAIMRENGAGTAEITHVLAQLKPVFLQYATRSQSFTPDPVDPDAMVRSLNDWVQRIVTGLLLELAAREIILYRAGVPVPR